MTTRQIIEAATELSLDRFDAERVDYVAEQFLYGNRSDSDLAMLADTIRPLLPREASALGRVKR